MSVGSGAPSQKQGFWGSQTPTAVILLVIAAVAAWYFAAGSMSTSVQGTPAVGVANGFVLVVVGFVAGLLGGLIGTGGCSVMLPAIHFWMGYPAAVAVGTTLFAVIFTATSGAYGHLMRRNLDVRAVAWLGLGGVVGVVLGSWLFTLLASQSALLGLILGLIFLWPAWGGGYALVPGLIYLFGAPVYITMSSSLATMIPLAVVGGGIKLGQGFVELGAGLLLGGGAVVGAQVGAAIIKRFKPATLKLLFGLYFLYVAVKFVGAYFGIAIW